MNSFVHLHNHSEYSLLDGFSRIPEMVIKAAELQQPALALTDHGNMHGAVEFYKAAKQAGIKPILGLEGYIVNGSRFDRPKDERYPAHITLLVQNSVGYRNLVNLVSKSHLESFYYRARMDQQLLQQHSEGLIVLSGCPSSILSKMAKEGNDKQGLEHIGWYREVFGDRYYIELMHHEAVPNQDKIFTNLTDWAKRTNTPTVITNDNHYVTKDEAHLADILTCIQTNTNIEDTNRLRLVDNAYYIKSSQEMWSKWGSYKDALNNTLAIAESVSFNMDFSNILLPRYKCPEGLTSAEYLTRLSKEGLTKRYGKDVPSSIKERLEYELNIVKTTHFEDYFLVCWDIFNFVNEKEILSAVRGSASSSLILFCLEVTNIDPIKTGLVFERFLNLERREMPDIDMDFQDDRRAEVIQYCMNKYGSNHVAQIITFGTLGAKAALRDVGRVLNQPKVGAELAKLVPLKLGITLEDSVKNNSPLAKAVEKLDKKQREVYTKARLLEGSVRHSSIHAAGVVICEQPLTDYVPLQLPANKDDKAPPATQYAMNSISDIGLLKMDFLGLRNLTVIAQTLNTIQIYSGSKIAISDIPLNDKKTFQMLSKGETYGVFQLEGRVMTKYIINLAPNTIQDISAMIALYRPGPMEHIDTFISAKHGSIEISYPHKDLAGILEETYGVIVYQDQILLIARKFGGYSLGEADILRKAMGKKIPSVMAEQRGKFIQGAQLKGYSQELAESVFDLVEPFAGYAFNKAHSISYAYIAYWTAYLKANYPAEYFKALMDSTSHDHSRLNQCIQEAKKSSLDVLPPSINHSDSEFKLIYNESGQLKQIIFGLSAIKGIGQEVASFVVNQREDTGKFKNLSDILQRANSTHLKRRDIETLIKAGAMDEFDERNDLLNSINPPTQNSLLDLIDSNPQNGNPSTATSNNPKIQYRKWESELLSVEMTPHPYKKHLEQLQYEFIVYKYQLTDKLESGKPHTLRLIAQTRDIQQRSTRDNKTFIKLSLCFLDEQLDDVIVWTDVYKDNYHMLTEEGEYVILTVKAEKKQDGDYKIYTTKIKYFNPDIVANQHVNGLSVQSLKPKQHRIIITVPNEEHNQNTIKNVMRILYLNKGLDEVFFVVKQGSQEHHMKLPFISVNICEELQKSIADILGFASIETQDIL